MFFKKKLQLVVEEEEDYGDTAAHEEVIEEYIDE